MPGREDPTTIMVLKTIIMTWIVEISYLRMIYRREHVMEEMITESGKHNGFAEEAPGVWGLIHICGGVEHVKAPVSVCSELVSCMV